MKKILPLLIASLLLVLSTTLFAHAQLATADLSLSTIPLQPQPGQNVQIRVQSYGVDLTQANIQWTYNGKLIDSGVGRTTITILAPRDGSAAAISVTVSGDSFTRSTATTILRPGSVDIIWEGADSYTPPFYKGRSLVSTNGTIRTVAIPSFTAPKGLSYTWSQNGSVLQNNSGYQRTSLVLKNDTLNDTENITVDAESGAFSGSAGTTIVPGNPSLVGYQKIEGFTDYANGFTDSVNTAEHGVVLRIEPYYFSTPTSIDTDLQFSTTVNDSPVVGDPHQNELRIASPQGGGQAIIKAIVTTVQYSLQQLTRSLTIQFN